MILLVASAGPRIGREKQMRSQRGLYATIIALIIVSLPVRSATAVEVSGPIASDTTWTAADTIHVTGDVTVEVSAHLTIEAGAVVLFSPGAGLRINGGLTADGRVSNRILFSSRADTVGGAPAAGSWDGVRLDTGCDGFMRNCNLRYANTCAYIYRSSPQIDSCVIEGFSSYGVDIDGGSSGPPTTPVIEHCVIRQTDPALLGTGVALRARYNTDVSIHGCALTNCYFGFEFYSGTSNPNFLVSQCEVRDHKLYGFYTHGT
jgi:hypothetical protein